jgi:hypothetical protein
MDEGVAMGNASQMRTAVEASLRREIVAAAGEELRIWGFERFNAAAVAGRAALAPDVVNELWGSTEELAIDAINGLGGLVVHIPDTGSLRSDLASLLSFVADYFNSETGRSLLRSAVIAPAQWAPTNVRTHLWLTSGKALRIIFERAERRNETRPGIDHNTTLQLATGPLFLRALYSNEAIDPAECTQIADMVWHAVRRVDAPTSDSAGPEPAAQ